jgi:RNA polymerase sigma-70 factor (ECF subfamily)
MTPEPPPTRETFALSFEACRKPLRRHCYRMLGGLHDADDAVQETFLRAWRGLDGFAGGSLRAWLTRIATRACLDALDRRAAERRWLPDALDPAATAGPGAADDVLWIEPLPDEAIDEAPGPEARYAAREAVRLAFVAAIQTLPPRQRAALLLADVLGWPAAEAAETLEVTPAALNSALQRARATLARGAPPPRGPAATEVALLDRYLRAWEAHDLDGLVATLKADAACVMPPWRLWLNGREAIAAFFAEAWSGCPGLRLIPISANDEPGFAVYQRAPGGGWNANALHVLTPEGAALTRMTLFLDFDGRLFEAFGLPRRLAP